MKCPHCETNLGQSVRVQVQPLVVEFGIGFDSRGQLVRLTEVDGTEIANIDVISAKTHTVTCPSCKKTIDPAELKFVPCCNRCGKEKAQMTVETNHCRYDGLVCLECIVARRNCVGCGYLSKCTLGKRAIKEIEK